jgi:FkbM family methyltransferase
MAADQPLVLDAAAREAPDQVALARFGALWMAYRAGTADEQVLFRESFDRDVYLRAFPHFQPERTHVFVHIGAHIGGFAVMAAPRVRHVYAIEASRETYDLLAANVHLNHLTNVTASHVAIADRAGLVTLYDSPSGTWGSSLTPRGGARAEQVRAMSLTDYFAEHAIERCDLLLCNAEGAEFPILLNASGVLDGIQRVAVMYHEDLSPGHTAQELLDHLRAHGFTARVAAVQAPQRGGIVAIRTR